MSRSFAFDEGKEGDNWLTLGLLAVVLFLSIFQIWFSFFGFTIYFGPLIAFFLTRALYKRHFRNQIASLRAGTSMADAPDPALREA